MIILVRHGEATHHTQHLTGGWTDSELTEKGKAQLRAAAEQLARDFAGVNLTNGQNYQLRILASDLKRAAESAQILADALGMRAKIEYCPFLREKNNGVAAGLTEEEAKYLFCKPATEQELDHRNYPGGETRREFYQRNVKGLWQCADMEHENLLIVAHKGTLQNIIFKWLGMDMEDVVAHNYSVDIAPASVTVLGINKWHEHTIFRLNDVSHLHQGKGFGIFNFKYEKK
ncbi:MAG: histidine phosphatase family protein [Phascolarctobacterium sp.]|nr:histidine phosphatase family protein [Phascolarctobacterium sp.]